MIERPAAPLAQVILVVAAATAAQTVVAMGSSTLPVIAPKLAATLSLDAAWIGAQVSIVYAAGALAALVAGGMVKRIGACRATQIAMLASACGAGLAALPHVTAIACASLLLGAALGLVTPPAAQLMLRFSPPSQLNLIFSIKQTGVPLGFTLSALIAPSVALTFGWQWSLAPVAVTALAIACILQCKRAEWDGDRMTSAALFESPFAGLLSIWQAPHLRWLVLTGSAYSAIQVCVGTFTVTMLVGEIGYGLVFAGVLTSLITLCGISARLLGGWIADRRQAAHALLALMGVGMGACCLALGLLTSEWALSMVALLFIVLGISVVGWNGILHAEVARSSPPERVSLTSSGVSFFIYVAVAVTPSVAAVIYGALGRYSLMFAVLSVFAILGLLSLRASVQSIRALG
jgi:MFS family permease